MRIFIGIDLDAENRAKIARFIEGVQSFAPDARWNPATLDASEQLYRELACLEETFATDPNFIDRATHLLLVAHPRATRRRTAAKH